MQTRISKNEKSNVRFTNFIYDEEKYYFIFIAELKAYGIGHFFREALSKSYKIDINKIEFISISPDVFEQYNYDNVIIINEEINRENKRQNLNNFIKEISNSKYIDSMIDTILENQNELFIYMFETNPYMTLDEKEGVRLIGPNKEIVSTLSDKINLYEIFSTIVPMANYSVASDYEELIMNADELFAKTKNPLFISLPRSAAGANSIIANNIEDIEKKFSTCKDENFLITEFIPHKADPTTLGVVINEEEIYIAGIADQRIDGTKFKGSTYPSKLSKSEQEEVISQARLVGKEMAKMGYRGIFGCDFIVTDDSKVYFIETNPRKQGTTMEFCCTLRNILPKGAPNLPEIELYAVTKNKKAPKMVEPDFFGEPLICWGTYNYKIEQKLTTHSYLPQQNGEIAMFDNIAKNKINKEFMVVEHIGQDFFVNEGSFLGRVIAVGKTHKDVDDGIDMGRRILNYTIKTVVDENFSLDEKCYECPYYLKQA
ncbi:ATP-grasp domain-containing protein [Sulfurospirillum sp. 1307]|jgi:predicted ATP-grasp superfamily ATP-dependent carboligase